MSDQAAWEPGQWAISRQEYHDDRAHVNHSSLEDFRYSPAYYHGRYVSGTIPQRTPTPAMQRGTWLHLAVLEPDLFRASCVLAPVGLDRRTKAGKECWAEFTQANEGKHVLAAEDMDVVLGMARGVRANALVWDWLSRPGASEQAVRWRDPDTGLACKALKDRLSGEVIVDLKTAADPRPAEWAKAVVRFGYHRQAAFYTDGARQALDLRDPLFVHVVVGNEPPYECFPYILEPDAIVLGRTQNRATLMRLRECLEVGVWEHPCARDLTTIRLPRWAWEEE